MSITDKFENLKFRLMVVERLRLLKRMYSYKELSKVTGVPETVLCRYVKGSILPSLEQAERIWKSLDKILDVKTLIKDKIEITEEGYIDITPILSDPYTLGFIAHYAYMKFAGKRITKVVTPAVNGIPIATSIALTLQVPLVIAKRSKDAAIRDYYEDSFVETPSSVVTFYIPRRAIRKRDEVLIVDDIVRTGKTLKTLINIVERARAAISGILVLIAIGDEWKKEIYRPVEVILKLPETYKM